jgi:hypothetical protein
MARMRSAKLWRVFNRPQSRFAGAQTAVHPLTRHPVRERQGRPQLLSLKNVLRDSFLVERQSKAPTLLLRRRRWASTAPPKGARHQPRQFSKAKPRDHKVAGLQDKARSRREILPHATELVRAPASRSRRWNRVVAEVLPQTITFRHGAWKPGSAGW